MIPTGWHRGCLADDIILVSGQHLLAEEYDENPDCMPYLTGPSDYTSGEIRATKFTKFPKSICEQGDILITVKGSGTGKSIIADRPYCISRQLMAIRPKSWDTYFVWSVVRMYEAKYENTSVGLIPGITRDDVLQTPIWVPIVSEQKTIGKKLLTWDRAIDLTERLIAAKQERRIWLMQQLLTGKRRLPGFDKSWQTVHLGDAFTNRVEMNFPDLPLVAITGENGIVSREDLVRRDTSSEDKSRYLRICPGDIGYNTMRMWQGVCGLSQLEGIVSPAYTIATPNDDVDGEFMALLFKSSSVVHLFHRHSQGLVDDTLNLKWRHFAEIKVPIPEKKEQQAIAAVFRTADRELNLLRTQLDALREQKKGLMQQLLTGKVRVKV
jgi:type I restriction enzyme S subunit